MGGSSKTWKQWNKYWADKKKAVKKKAAHRSAARNRTGGIEEMVALTEVEERIVALMGGESFASGDMHLAVIPFSNVRAESSVPGTSYLSARQSYVPEWPTQTTTGAISPLPRTSQHVVEQNNAHPARTTEHSFQHSSTPQTTHSTPSQLPLRTRNAPRNSPHRRRRHLVPPSPPSQRRSQLSSITYRFLRLEEERLQIDRRNSDLLEAFTTMSANQMQHLSEANSALAQALAFIGVAFQMLAERR